MIVPADPTAKALLRAVLEEPDADVHRLAFADRLEELGVESDRAELIRVQVDLAKPHPCAAPRVCFHGPNPPPEHLGVKVYFCGRLECPVRSHEVRGLHLREQEILGTGRVLNGLPGSVVVRVGNNSRFTKVADPLRPGSRSYEVVFRRGFVEEVKDTPVADFMAHAAELFSSHPITAVSLHGREPSQYTGVGVRGDTWYWVAAYGDTYHLRDRIPPEVARRLRGHIRERDGVYQFSSPAAAYAALSAALVAYGRSLAGLPPLPERGG